MKISRLAGVAALLAAGIAQAQDVKVNALIELWYTQMADNNLRLDSAVKPGGASAYYDGMSSGRFAENGFTVKRSEVYLSQTISDSISWNLMFDPNNSTSSVGNNVLHDAVITWNLGKGFVLKAGQFKMPTSYEATIVSAKDLYFFDRNQLNRVFGDKRDRGAWLSYAYGNAKGLNGKLSVAISNGSTDDGSGGKTAVDANSQKDFTVRYEGGFGSAHKFGAYYREGVTNLKNSTFVTPTTIPAGTTAQQIKDNKDKTTLQGLFYAYDTAKLHFDFEYATGLLGRRYPSLFAATTAAMSREHLDQKFAGYSGTLIYKMGQHQVALRYDSLHYNSGNNWYSAANPYKLTTGDYTPKYTETTVGYNYLFVPGKYSVAKLKLDYIMRSKNFLSPRAGQTGEQGGNSFVASLGIGF
ncbi:MAG: hypothetical protein HGB30_00130 [Holophagaceae bacterium]|nr:hypothetical protein [Holophagaceae bacterium]